jgi:hypothetical protein
VYDALALANVQPSSLPAGLDFVKYAKWRRGEDNGVPAPTIVRPDLQGAYTVGVIAFGLAHTDAAAKMSVDSTKRARDFVNGSTAGAADFGVLTGSGATPPDLTGYNPNGSFVPAIGRIRKQTSETGTTTTSHITGRKYKKYPANNYSIPMGQGASARGYQDAIADVLSGNAADTTLSFSFRPEQWRRD